MSGLKRVFADFRVGEGLVAFECSTFEDGSRSRTDEVFFQLSDPIVPRNELIALACSTLCGGVFDEVVFELPLDISTVAEIEVFTGATVRAQGSDAGWRGLKWHTSDHHSRMRDGVILNFSGGYDSIATLCVLPEDVHLVAVDFGGAFQRETEFFTAFSPHVVTTNLRRLGYDRSSWTFMGVGALLYSDYLQAGLNVFGTVLEATPHHFKRMAEVERTAGQRPFSSAGMNNGCFANGLTEAATAMIIKHYRPELIGRSLQSLAAPGSEKLFRKQALTQIAYARFGGGVPPVELGRVDPPKAAVAFGSNFALDFLALYELKHAGLAMVNETVVEVPSSAVQLAERLDLTFYERLNTNFLWTIPIGYRGEYLRKLADAGVVPYDERDFDEFREVASLLSNTRR